MEKENLFSSLQILVYLKNTGWCECISMFFYVLMYWLLNWFDIYINKQFFDEEFDEPTVPVNVVSA